MVTSPGHSTLPWRGASQRSSTSSNAGVQARSQLVRVLNGVLLLCGVSYLLYICVLALDPRTLLASSHNAYRLRVHVRR